MTCAKRTSGSSWHLLQPTHTLLQPLRQLLQPRLAPTTLAMMLVWFAAACGYYGVVMITMEISVTLAAAHSSAADPGLPQTQPNVDHSTAGTTAGDWACQDGRLLLPATAYLQILLSTLAELPSTLLCCLIVAGPAVAAATASATAKAIAVARRLYQAVAECLPGGVGVTTKAAVAYHRVKQRGWSEAAELLESGVREWDAARQLQQSSSETRHCRSKRHSRLQRCVAGLLFATAAALALLLPLVQLAVAPSNCPGSANEPDFNAPPSKSFHCVHRNSGFGATASFLAQVCLFAARCCIMGAFTLLYILTSHLYHTRVRASALGVCNAVSRLGALVAPLVTVGLVGAGGKLWLPTGLLVLLCTLAGVAVVRMRGARQKVMPGAEM